MLGSENSIFNRKEIIDKQTKLKKLYESIMNNPETKYF